MNQDILTILSIVSALMWLTGALYAFKGSPNRAIAWTLIGVAVFGCAIAWMWIELERPPLRTVGETRMWYSLFLPLFGAMIYSRYRYKWIVCLTAVMSTVFVAINIARPEALSKGLVPALQSAWFVPHVTLYMLAYAMLGTATVTAVYLLWRQHNESETRDEQILCDRLTSAGTALLMLGMITGAFWAKEAWGHYWTWDPKETWACATWLSYLVYIHLRRAYPALKRPALWILLTAFLFLQMCWWGINLIPALQSGSLHVYGA